MSGLPLRTQRSSDVSHSSDHNHNLRYQGSCGSRSKSPGKLLMQVHDRLIEESKNKELLTHELNSMKRRIEEFSIRLDFILKCM